MKNFLTFEKTSENMGASIKQQAVLPPSVAFFIGQNIFPETPRTARRGTPPVGCRQVSGLLFLGESGK